MWWFIRSISSGLVDSLFLSSPFYIYLSDYDSGFLCTYGKPEDSYGYINRGQGMCLRVLSVRWNWMSLGSLRSSARSKEKRGGPLVATHFRVWHVDEEGSWQGQHSFAVDILGQHTEQTQQLETRVDWSNTLNTVAYSAPITTCCCCCRSTWHRFSPYSSNSSRFSFSNGLVEWFMSEWLSMESSV